MKDINKELQDCAAKKPKQKGFIEVTQRDETFLLNSKEIILHTTSLAPDMENCELQNLSGYVICNPDQTYSEIKDWILNGQEL